jgi:hypothetical protein
LSQPTVRLSNLPPGEVLAQTVGFLGDDLFAAFRGVMDGHAGRREAGNDGRPGYVFPLAGLPEVVTALRKASVPNELAPDLVAILRARADAAKTSGEAANAWILDARGKLKARGEALRPFQEIGVTFLHENPAAILADDMGLGKTPQALIAIRDRCLWITNASLVGDCVKAVERWRPDLRATELTAFRWPAKGEVCVLTYGRLPQNLHPAEAHAPVDMDLIADEAKALRGAGSNRSTFFRAVSRAVAAAPGTRRWLLEGTPLMNYLDELWNLLAAVGLAQDMFGTKKHFRKLARDNRDAFVALLRRVMIRREKDEVMPELPRTTRSNHTVHLDDATREALDDVLRELCKYAGQAAVDRYLSDVRRLDLEPDPTELVRIRDYAEHNVQAAIDLAFDKDAAIPFQLTSRVKSILALAKTKSSIQFLKDMAPRFVKNNDGTETLDGAPLLFFSEHVRPVEEAAAAIPGAAVITGATPARERTEIVERFQKGLIPVLACTSATGGVGLTLTAAYTAVFNDLPWNYALVNQAEDRMRRPGQASDKIMAIRVVGDHVLDDRILELITQKQILAQETVGRTTIGGHADALERPDALARALATALDGAKTSELTIQDAPARGPATADERWVAHLFGTKPEVCKKGSKTADHLLQAWLASGGKLTHRQWFAATAWAHHRATTAPSSEGHRGPVTETERSTRDLLLALAADNGSPVIPTPHDQPLIRNLSQAAGNGGLTDGEWAFAALVTRKYRKGTV